MKAGLAVADEACRLCGAPSPKRVGAARVLGRHEAVYASCAQCDFLQVSAPGWLDEAYSEALSDLDTGVLVRTQDMICRVRLLGLALGIAPDDPCLDFGGGYGLFVRAARDAGLNFHWHDRRARNLLARGFDGRLGDSYRLVTAFEVFEHLLDARADLDAIFGPRPGAVLAGTALHSGFDPDWYYLFPETGQHIGFFSERTMAFVAERYGYRALCSPQVTLFLPVSEPLEGLRLRWLAKLVRFPYSRTARLSRWWLQRRHPLVSRTWNDHLLLKRRLSASP